MDPAGCTGMHARPSVLQVICLDPFSEGAAGEQAATVNRFLHLLRQYRMLKIVGSKHCMC